MGIADYILLAGILTAVYFALRGTRRKGGCHGRCGSCSCGCDKDKNG